MSSSVESRPEVPEGYLGQQPKFAEFKLECISHTNAEFTIPNDNEVEIKIRTSGPIKSTANLIQVRTEKEFPEYVFTQTQGDIVSFVISFPEHGWYKFQIFALPASDESKSLPNVINYLIEVKRALKAVYPFAKQYAPWREGCYLYSPLILNSSSRLHTVNFKVLVPRAKDVAIVAAGEWTHLTKTSGDVWEGKATLDQHRNKNVKVTLNARFGDDESKYATLLEWVV
ncbi:hypothetical protein C0Q70_09725 [Pomacea canaliculata]|uniref:KY-like immunoglobulin-like domain-containing protein n=1 Tax=Pomacea canaliculata TaxID=400727 RepID=A0A2T7PAL8_POMCA|nr:uncharacterized protein LOC112564910 [Pomacea canaliculata]PVD30459.1 hypothetical protein C0Q70_09725 [Pomacea canaliculata]